MRLTETVAFLVVIFTVTILNWGALTTYFSQDDFFHLNVVFNKPLTDVPSFFLSKQTDYAFYRPLSRETFNLLMYKTFGLESLPFHLINLILISVIGLYVFLLSRKIFNNQLISWFSIIIYSISSIHNIELYYLASVQMLLATIFVCSSIFSYLNKKILLSFIFFVLGLMSHEITIVLPGLILLIELLILEKKPFNYRSFNLFLIFMLIDLIYLVTSLLTVSLPGQQEYKPVLSLKSILNGLGWYVAWSFGLPEILVDFVGSGLKLNPNFIKWYSSYISAILPAFISIFFSLIILLLFLWNKLNKKSLFFLGSTFVVSVSPFLLFPQHKFIYYLILSQVWFAISLGMILSIAWSKKGIYRLITLGFIVSLAIVSYHTIKINEITYWAAKRAVAAEYILNDLKVRYPKVDSGTIFFVQDDPKYPVIAEEWGTSSKQAFYILSGKDAFQLFYRDPSIKVYYQAFDQPPKSNSQNKIILYTAKFPY